MSNYVYVNLNTASNTVGAYSIDPSNNPIPLVPATYLTGGNGTGYAYFSAQNATLCKIGSFLYIVNSGDTPFTTISGFQINPSDGSLSSLFSSPISTNGTIYDGHEAGQILCTPNGEFLYSINIGSNNITIFQIESGGTLLQIDLYSVSGSPILDGAIITPDGNFLIICDSNSTNVRVFAIANDGNLSEVPNSPFNFPNGDFSAGIAITSNGQYIFVAQLSAIVTLGIDSNGNLSFKADTTTGIENVQDVIVSVDSKYLFASDNGTFNALSFTINNDGSLTSISNIPSGNDAYLYLLELNQYGTLLYILGFNIPNSTINILNIDSTGALSLVSGSPFPMSTFVLASGIVSFPPPTTICFLEGTKILCYYHNKEVYLPIEQLTARILVKTFKNGYLPINLIGTSKIYHSERNPKLYQCTRNEYPELTENLVITGGHSILADELTEDQRKKIGKIFVTDGKYRLLSKFDDRASVYDNKGYFTVYHFSLENGDRNRNYGIYANGLLVESCFEDTIRSNMTCK